MCSASLLLQPVTAPGPPVCLGLCSAAAPRANGLSPTQTCSGPDPGHPAPSSCQDRWTDRTTQMLTRKHSFIPRCLSPFTALPSASPLPPGAAASVPGSLHLKDKGRQGLLRAAATSMPKCQPPCCSPSPSKMLQQRRHPGPALGQGFPHPDNSQGLGHMDSARAHLRTLEGRFGLWRNFCHMLAPEPALD